MISTFYYGKLGHQFLSEKQNMLQLFKNKIPEHGEKPFQAPGLILKYGRLDSCLLYPSIKSVCVRQHQKLEIKLDRFEPFSASSPAVKV